MQTPKALLIICLFALSFTSFAQEGVSIKFEQVLSLRNAGTPIISPDGKHVAFTVSSTDWKENSYDTEIWLVREGEAPFQLTRTQDGTSSSPKWSPDGKWIAFTAKRGEKTQIHVISPFGGEAQPVTNEDEGVSGFEWSPDGKHFAITKQEPESKADKKRKERFGSYEVDEEEYRLTHLWLVEFKPDMMPAPHEMPCNNESKDSTEKSDCITLPKATRLTEGDFTVSDFQWSPDGKMIAITHRPNPLINSSVYSDISILEVNNKKLTELVKTHPQMALKLGRLIRSRFYLQAP